MVWNALLMKEKEKNVRQFKGSYHSTIIGSRASRNSNGPSHTPNLSELDFPNSPVRNIQFDELDFFPSLKPTGYFFQFKLISFSSFMARVKYFDGPCLTIYSLSTIYRDIHYQFLVWWIHYSHCYKI